MPSLYRALLISSATLVLFVGMLIDTSERRHVVAAFVLLGLVGSARAWRAWRVERTSAS